MIETILWDFDGVLLNSNKVRDIGFVEVLKIYPKNQVDSLLEYHHLNGGLSRYVKFRYFFESIRDESISEEDILVLSTDFSKIMRRLLVDRNLLINKSVEFVKRNHQKYAMHIISGSDQNELRFLCESLEILKYFKSVLGSPTQKNDLVRQTLEKYQYSNKTCLFIGDSINDLEAAICNNILFMGFNNPTLEKKSDLVLF